MRERMRKNAGFTLTEILIVLGVLAVVLFFSISTFSSFYKKTDLDTSRDNIVSTLKTAKNKTLASEQAAQYGVYFDTSSDPDRYIFFQGSSYNSRNTAFDEIYELSQNIEITSYTFNPSGSEVVFNRLKGDTVNSGFVIIQSKKTQDTRTIYIYPSGEISGLPQSVPGPGLISDSRHTHFDLGWDMSGATTLRFDFVNAGVIEEIPMIDYFSFEGFGWSGKFSINNVSQEFKIHTHQLIPSTVLCIHRDRNNNKNNEEVYIYIVQDGLEKEIAHYDNDLQATVFKGSYVWGQMEKQ